MITDSCVSIDGILQHKVSCMLSFTLLSVSSNPIFHFAQDWMKEYGKMPHGTVISHHYKEYLEDNNLAEKVRDDVLFLT